ncbi:asparaginase [Paenarthrobacter sp. DKR-5]|uniref:asparaginase n=1 Tax=Paenarthrobacter sp. DKR-5 TaxID=2835535 RepID=UPI001BDD551F|nr:asparaginase [Paenarthrobacter sp. DKR-5]MBT1001558.1 asparaginase [Paenarthrobacter sp. DKR-5]
MTETEGRRHVVLLATGGTISSRVQADAGGATVASDTGVQVLKGIESTLSCPVRVIDVFRKGSYLLTVDDMLALCGTIREALADPDAAGAVVTHGTDTMEETAFLADLTHEDPRPVVFTGAQNAADSEQPDGPDNLARAIAVAASPAAAGRGVLLAFAGGIYPARGVRKSQTFDLSAFANPDFGLAGSVSARNDVEMGPATARPGTFPLPAPDAPFCRVDVIAAYPGADAKPFRAAVAAGARGIVLQATGSGNANPALCEAVAGAVADGVVVVTSTRVYAGPVKPVYGAGGGRDLLAAGAIPSGLLRPSQSLVLLSLLLRLGAERQEIAEQFVKWGSFP